MTHALTKPTLIALAWLLVCPGGQALAAPARSKEVAREDRRGAKVKPRRKAGLRRLKVRGKRRLVKIKRGAKALGKRLRVPPKVKKSMARKMRVMKGYATITADKIERALPRRMSRGFHKMRLLSPGALGGFAGSKFKQDPLFLTSFGVAYPIAAHMQIPAFIALGMNPVAAVVAHEITEVPVSLGILAWRQHHLRKDRSQSFGGTLKTLGKEYKAFAKQDRQKSRDFMKRRARVRQKSKLRSMSAGLAR